MFAFYDDYLPVSINNHVFILWDGMGWMMDEDLYFSLPQTQRGSKISVYIVLFYLFIYKTLKMFLNRFATSW